MDILVLDSTDFIDPFNADVLAFEQGKELETLAVLELDVESDFASGDAHF